jgi:hypothetical protein
MSGRRMKITKCKDGSWLIRIRHLHEDQIKTIQLALEIARSECQSDFDSVAIEGICMAFISSGAVLPTQKPSVRQVLLDAANAAFAAYNKHWDAAMAEFELGEAANLPKMKADIEAGDAPLLKFLAEWNDANVEVGSLFRTSPIPVVRLGVAAA